MPVGDLLWVGFEGKVAPEALLGRIARREVGGVVLFARNLAHPQQIKQLVASLQAASPTGANPEMVLPVAIDQEGGRVQRLPEPATKWPPMAAVGSIEDLGLTREVGQAIGQELAALGINCNFAPCVDVHTLAENPIIGDRAFSSDPVRAALHGVAFLRGLGAAGVAGCAKHYPGHGHTSLDSHEALPIVDRSADVLHKTELVPFESMIAANVPMIMTAHVIYTSIDPERPATLSPIWLRILRDQLGYKGLIVSDDLEMKAISAQPGRSVGQAAVEAIRAGCDVLLVCRNADMQVEVAQALERAYWDDKEVRRRIEESQARVEKLRATLGRGPAEGDATKFPIASHQSLAKRIAEQRKG